MTENPIFVSDKLPFPVKNCQQLKIKLLRKKGFRRRLFKAMRDNENFIADPYQEILTNVDKFNYQYLVYEPVHTPYELGNFCWKHRIYIYIMVNGKSDPDNLYIHPRCVDHVMQDSTIKWRVDNRIQWHFMEFFERYIKHKQECIW